MSKPEFTIYPDPSNVIRHLMMAFAEGVVGKHGGNVP